MTQKKWKAIKYQSIYWLVKSLITISGLIPRKILLATGDTLGLLSFYIFKKSSAVIAHNLHYIFGNQMEDKAVRQFSKKVFRNIGKNAMDLLRAFHIKSLAQLDKIVINQGLEHFDNAYKKGKGVIILTCHLGAFEFIESNLSLRGYGINVIVKKLKDERLNYLLLKSRTSRGSDIIYSGEETIKLLRALKKGEAVIILIDQDIKKIKGAFVDFYGKPAYTPIGATILALKTEAAVIPMATHRLDNNQHQITTLPEVAKVRTGNYEEDIRQNTQIFTNYLENFIREAPSQWVWLHERWKTQPEEVNSTV